MPRPLPPLTWFRSFEASARHLSFTAAADELGLTQSAISQQVRALEMRLGVDLFVRKARGLALTDDGRKLAPKVGASLDQLAEATAGFEAGPTEGLFTVAASISVTRWIIGPRIGAFLAAHPGVRIRMLGTIWPDDFKSSLADVEIRFGSEKQVGRGAVRLLPDDLVAVSASSDGAALVDQTLIETVGTSCGWREWASELGISPLPRPALYVDSYGAALDLAAAGAGVALTSSLLASGALAQGQVALADERSLPNNEGYFLALNSDDNAAKAFAAWIQSLVSAS